MWICGKPILNPANEVAFWPPRRGESFAVGFFPDQLYQWSVPRFTCHLIHFVFRFRLWVQRDYIYSPYTK